MKRYLSSKLLTLLFAAAPVLAFTSASAQEMPVEGPVRTSATVSIESKHDAAFDPKSLTIQIAGHAVPIASITPVGQAPAQVAVLIDEGIRQSFAQQMGDMKKFLRSWPAGTQLLVGYMQNGTVRTRGFTTNADEAAEQLRLTFSVPGESASPYFCLSEFVKNWPNNSPGARTVLMLTNGVDPYNGRPSVLNQDSPYVQQAQEDAQRAGVAVYSIYYGDAGFRGARGSFSGQSYLNQVAEATGGQVFNNGTITPPSIEPYLDQFRRAVNESFVISFDANAAHVKRGDLLHLQVKTSQHDIHVRAPQGVHPGVNELAPGAAAGPGE